MGFFGSIGKAGKALGGALGAAPGGKALGSVLGAAPGGKAVTGALGLAGAKPMAGAAGGGALGGLAGKIASAKGSLAAKPAPVTSSMSIGGPGTDVGLSAAGPTLAAGQPLGKKSFLGQRNLRGGRR